MLFLVVKVMSRFRPSMLKKRFDLQLKNLWHVVIWVFGENIGWQQQYKMLSEISELVFRLGRNFSFFDACKVRFNNLGNLYNVRFVECNNTYTNNILNLPKRIFVLVATVVVLFL